MRDILTWEYVKRPIIDAEITNLEIQLGCKFPTEYITIVKSFHAGRPSRRMFDTQKTKGSIIKTFLPITEDFKVNIFNVKKWLQLPETMIPFASTPSGDYICFDYFSKDTTPSIVLWNHEKKVKELITLTFAKFMNSLYSINE